MGERILSDYVIKRLLQGILLILVVSILVFAMMDLMPGDPVDLLTDRKVSQEIKDKLKAQYGLDLPLPQRYWKWITDVFKGNFGTSIRTKLPVNAMLAQRLPTTIKLTGIALLVEILIAIPIGLLAAYKKDGFFDRLMMSISLFFAALPSFWVAVLLILFFGVTLRVLPLSELNSAKHYILPVSAMVLGGIATTIRMTKTEVLDVLREKYVLTAYAKGLPKKTVLIRHVLRNALILVMIMIFMSIPWVISGAVIIENIFVIPGMGKMLTEAILAQDFTVVQASVLLIAVLTVVSNLICDVLTAILDPRIRISMGEDLA